jgi:hypothetical protein
VSSANTGSNLAGNLVLLVAFGFTAAVVIAVALFILGPAKHRNDYVDALAARIPSRSDRELFLRMYSAAGPKSVVGAWLLTACFSPTISYLYQGRWVLAGISFITFQGFFLWWLVALFTMPFDVMKRNDGIADTAFKNLMISRPLATSRPSSWAY